MQLFHDFIVVRYCDLDYCVLKEGIATHTRDTQIFDITIIEKNSNIFEILILCVYINNININNKNRQQLKNLC